MPITTLNPLEIADWDMRVAALPGATIFHSSSWARAVAETYGYQPCYLAVPSESGYEAVLPLMEVDSRLNGRRGVGLPFTDLCAPLGEPAATARLTAAALDLGRERRWKYLELRAEPADATTPRSTTFHHHTLALRPDEAELLAACDSSTRRAVRKARDGNLSVERTSSTEAMRAFYRLLAFTRRRHGVPPQPRGFFDAVQRHLLAPGHGDLFLARHEGLPVAAILCLHFGNHVVYKYGASDERFQHLRANNLVMWEALRHYGGEGRTLFDFGRTSLDNDGLRRFKRGWGAEEVTVGYLRTEPASGLPLLAPDKASGWHNKIFRALPIAISRAIGTLLYRHLG